ncbi:MAG: glycosyltransferase, partial [Chthonomonadales bacterium]
MSTSPFSSMAPEIQSGFSRLQGGCRCSITPAVVCPLVSIVVVVYRDRAEVGALVENLAPFRSRDLEVIIIDGASDDGTVEFLSTNSDQIDFWLSEPDNGIYHAMNKGLAKASGEYILF